MIDHSERRDASGPVDILESLSRLPGIEGGVVATDDGLPLATRFSSRLDGETLAAAAAAMGQSTRNVLRGITWGELGMAVLEGSRMKFLVCPLSVGYLLALAKPDADLRAITPQVSVAARDLDQAFASLAGSTRSIADA
jgi:predicted regulator of Ras-like GTPase activity (Roadblock/LC7/MglB family)